MLRKIFCVKNGPLRSGWSIALILLAGFLLLPAGYGYLMYRLVIPRFPASPLFQIPYFDSILMSLFLSLAVILIWKLVYRLPLYRMGLSPSRWLREMGYGLLFGVVSFAAAYLILLVTGGAEFLAFSPEMLRSPMFYGSLVRFVGVGFYEELMCRGYMMSALQTTRSKWVVLLAPSVLFSLLHAFNTGFTYIPMINIILVGLLFALLFAKSGKLWLPIGYHISWNFVQGNVFGMPVSGGSSFSLITSRLVEGRDWLGGGDFGPEGGFAVTVVILLGILWVQSAMKRPKTGHVWKIEQWL